LAIGAVTTPETAPESARPTAVSIHWMIAGAAGADGWPATTGAQRQVEHRQGLGEQLRRLVGGVHPAQHAGAAAGSRGQRLGVAHRHEGGAGGAQLRSRP
jgi:hypothetical protein